MHFEKNCNDQFLDCKEQFLDFFSRHFPLYANPSVMEENGMATLKFIGTEISVLVEIDEDPLKIEHYLYRKGLLVAKRLYEMHQSSVKQEEISARKAIVQAKSNNLKNKEVTDQIKKITEGMINKVDEKVLKQEKRELHSIVVKNNMTKQNKTCDKVIVSDLINKTQMINKSEELINKTQMINKNEEVIVNNFVTDEVTFSDITNDDEVKNDGRINNDKATVNEILNKPRIKVVIKNNKQIYSTSEYEDEISQIYSVSEEEGDSSSEEVVNRQIDLITDDSSSSEENLSKKVTVKITPKVSLRAKHLSYPKVNSKTNPLVKVHPKAKAFDSPMKKRKPGASLRINPMVDYENKNTDPMDSSPEFQEAKLIRGKINDGSETPTLVIDDENEIFEFMDYDVAQKMFGETLFNKKLRSNMLKDEASDYVVDYETFKRRRINKNYDYDIDQDNNVGDQDNNVGDQDNNVKDQDNNVGDQDNNDKQSYKTIKHSYEVDNSPRFFHKLLKDSGGKFSFIVSKTCLYYALVPPEYEIAKENDVFRCEALFYDLKFCSNYEYTKVDSKEGAAELVVDYLKNNWENVIETDKKMKESIRAID